MILYFNDHKTKLLWKVTVLANQKHYLLALFHVYALEGYSLLLYRRLLSFIETIFKHKPRLEGVQCRNVFITCFTDPFLLSVQMLFFSHYILM